MVVVRLARGGSKGRPFYRIVVADSRAPRDGKFIEKIGFYNPLVEASEGLKVTMDRLTHWSSVCAQVSPAVKRLVKMIPAA